jgi:predicted AlkP superfamily pyrophosphatase or phosphodiesterase
MKGGIVIASALLLASCAAGPASRPAAHAPDARVVVSIVFDQLGSSVLERELPHLDEKGAIRRTIARGTYVHRVEYGFSSTFTAPGHAAIYSGAAPRESGIGSNRLHSRVKGGPVSRLDDGRHAVLGRPGSHSSPSALRAETVADRIQASRPDSIVASIAMKARSAVLPGGQRPDLCLWFDARAGGFTTSAWYAGGVPDWVSKWQQAHPFAKRLSPPWTPLDAAALEARLGPDARSGEGAYGFDAAFPHDATGLEDPDAFSSIPGSVEHQLEFADEVVARTGIGADAVPDLLAISIAATDYVGHSFGPDSWEYADVLRRVDRSLGDFLARLEQRVGPVAVLLTSDHGAAPLPERSAERGTASYRVSSDEELEALRVAIERKLGAREGGWVEAWVQPYVTLVPDIAVAERTRAIEAVVDFLPSRPGIARAYDARALAARDVAPSDRVDALVWRGIPRDPPGDVYVLPAEKSVAVEGLPLDRGTSHGSVWAYDREVPAIYAGPGVAHREIDEVLPHCKVAGTIARLATIDAPAHACGSLP